MRRLWSCQQLWVEDTHNYFVGSTQVLVHNTCDEKTRRQAFNEAKSRSGVPTSQQPDRQWIVGNDTTRGYSSNYRYNPNQSTHGRYYEYDTPNGKRVVVEHISDGEPHFHAGQPKASFRNGNPYGQFEMENIK